MQDMHSYDDDDGLAGAPALMRPLEVEKRTGITPRTLRAWAARGLIKISKPVSGKGGTVLIYRDSLRRRIAAGTKNGPKAA